MTKQRRWLKSVIEASQEKQVALPFQRGNRRRPEASKTDTAPQARNEATATR